MKRQLAGTRRAFLTTSAGLAILASITAQCGNASDYPQHVEADCTIRDFQFESGAVLPELRLHYAILQLTSTL